MKAIDDLARDLADPRKADRVGQYAVACIQRKIHEGKFVPNSQITSDVKKGSPPLSDRAQLVTSITYWVTPNSVIIGTNHPGAVINNYGGTITAKKEWLVIPASSHTRTLQRRYGWTPKEVCDGLRADGFSVWRQGRALFYRKKGPGSSKRQAHLIFILKKSVKIPKREFFRLEPNELEVIMEMIRGRK